MHINQLNSPKLSEGSCEPGSAIKRARRGSASSTRRYSEEGHLLIEVTESDCVQVGRAFLFRPPSFLGNKKTVSPNKIIFGTKGNEENLINDIFVGKESNSKPGVCYAEIIHNEEKGCFVMDTLKAPDGVYCKVTKREKLYDEAIIHSGIAHIYVRIISEDGKKKLNLKFIDGPCEGHEQ